MKSKTEDLSKHYLVAWIYGFCNYVGKGRSKTIPQIRSIIEGQYPNNDMQSLLSKIGETIKAVSHYGIVNRVSACFYATLGKYDLSDLDEDETKTLLSELQKQFPQVKFSNPSKDINPLEQQFIEACAIGDSALVSYLLSDSEAVKPYCQNNKGLLLACANGQAEVVKLLLEYPGIDCLDPINNAFKQILETDNVKNTKTIQELIIDNCINTLKVKEEFEWISDTEETGKHHDITEKLQDLFINACAEGNLKVAKFLMEAFTKKTYGGVAHYHKFENGLLPAVNSGNADLVLYLTNNISYSSKKDYPFRYGGNDYSLPEMTVALLEAASKKNLSCVQLLSRQERKKSILDFLKSFENSETKQVIMKVLEAGPYLHNLKKLGPHFLLFQPFYNPDRRADVTAREESPPNPLKDPPESGP